MAKIQVNKIEGAQRQIDTAIRLLFANEDPLAILTLASGAFRVLRDLSEFRGAGPLWVGFKDVIKPGMEGEFFAALHMPANFLKHADRAPDGVLDNLDEAAIDGILQMATVLYRDLCNEITVEMNAFTLWNAAMRPHFFNFQGEAKERVDVAAEALKGLSSRAEQLSFGGHLLEELRAKGVDRIPMP